MSLNDGQTETNFFFTALDGLKGVQMSLYEHALSLASIVDLVITDSMEALEGLYRELEEGGPADKKLVVPRTPKTPVIDLSYLWGLLALTDKLSMTSLYITAIAFLMTVSSYTCFTALYRRYRAKLQLSQQYSAFKFSRGPPDEDLLRKPILIIQKISHTHGSNPEGNVSATNSSLQVSCPWESARANGCSQSTNMKSEQKKNDKGSNKTSTQNTRSAQRKWLKHSASPGLSPAQRKFYAKTSPKWEEINKNIPRDKPKPEGAHIIHTRWNGGARKRCPGQTKSLGRRPALTQCTKSGSERNPRVHKTIANKKLRQTPREKQSSSKVSMGSTTASAPTGSATFVQHRRSKRSSISSHRRTDMAETAGASIHSDNSSGGIGTNTISRNQNSVTKTNCATILSKTETKQNGNKFKMKSPKRIKKAKPPSRRGRDLVPKEKKLRKRCVKRARSTTHKLGLKRAKIDRKENNDTAQTSYLADPQQYILSNMDLVKPTPSSALTITMDSDSFSIKRNTPPVLNSLRGQGAFKSYTRQSMDTVTSLSATAPGTSRPHLKDGPDIECSDYSKHSVFNKVTQCSAKDYGPLPFSTKGRIDGTCTTKRDNLLSECTLGNTGRHNTKFLRAKSQLFDRGIHMAPVPTQLFRHASQSKYMKVDSNEKQQRSYWTLKPQDIQNYQGLKQTAISVENTNKSKTDAFKFTDNIISTGTGGMLQKDNSHMHEQVGNTHKDGDAKFVKNTNQPLPHTDANALDREKKLSDCAKQPDQPRLQFIASSRLAGLNGVPVSKSGQDTNDYRHFETDRSEKSRPYENQPEKSIKRLIRHDFFKMITVNQRENELLEPHRQPVYKLTNDQQHLHRPAHEDKQGKMPKEHVKPQTVKTANETETITTKGMDRQSIHKSVNDNSRGEKSRHAVYKLITGHQQKSTLQEQDGQTVYRVSHGSQKVSTAKEWDKQNVVNHWTTPQTPERERMQRFRQNQLERTQKESDRLHTNQMADENHRVASKELDTQIAFKLKNEGNNIIQEQMAVKQSLPKNPHLPDNCHVESEAPELMRDLSHTFSLISSLPVVDKTRTETTCDKPLFEQHTQTPRSYKLPDAHVNTIDTTYKHNVTVGKAEKYNYQWETQPECTEENTVFKVTKNKITTVRSITGNEQPPTEFKGLQTRKALIDRATEQHNDTSNFQTGKKGNEGSTGQFNTALHIQHSHPSSDIRSQSETSRHDQPQSVKYPDRSVKKAGMGYLTHSDHETSRSNSQLQDRNKFVLADLSPVYEKEQWVATNASKEHRSQESTIPIPQEGNDYIAKCRTVHANLGLEFSKHGTRKDLPVIFRSEDKVPHQWPDGVQHCTCQQNPQVYKVNRKHCNHCQESPARHLGDIWTVHSETGRNRCNKTEIRDRRSVRKTSSHHKYPVHKSKSVISVGQMLSELTASSRSKSAASPAKKSKTSKKLYGKACKVIYFTPKGPYKGPKYMNGGLYRREQRTDSVQIPQNNDKAKTVDSPYYCAGNANYVRYYRLKKFTSHRHEPYKRHVNNSSDSTSATPPSNQYRYLIRNKNNCSPSRRGRYVLGPLLDKQCFVQAEECRHDIDQFNITGYNFGYGNGTEIRELLSGESDRPGPQIIQPETSKPCGQHQHQTELIIEKQLSNRVELNQQQPDDTANQAQQNIPQIRKKQMNQYGPACNTSRLTAENAEFSMNTFQVIEETARSGIKIDASDILDSRKNPKFKQEDNLLPQGRPSHGCHYNHTSKSFNRKELLSAGKTYASSRHDFGDQQRLWADSTEVESPSCQTANRQSFDHRTKPEEKTLPNTHSTDICVPYSSDTFSSNSQGSYPRAGRRLYHVKSPNIAQHQLSIMKKQLFLAHSTKNLKPYRLKRCLTFEKAKPHFRGKRLNTEKTDNMESALLQREQRMSSTAKHTSPELESHMTQTENYIYSVHVAVQTSPYLSDDSERSQHDRRREWKTHTTSRLQRDKSRIIKGTGLIKQRRTRPGGKDRWGTGTDEGRYTPQKPNPASYKSKTSLDSGTNALIKKTGEQPNPLENNITNSKHPVQIQDKRAGGALSEAAGGSVDRQIPRLEKKSTSKIVAAGQSETHSVLKFFHIPEQGQDSSNMSKDRMCVISNHTTDCDAGKDLPQQLLDTKRSNHSVPQEGIENHQIPEEGTLKEEVNKNDNEDVHNRQRDCHTTETLSSATGSQFSNTALDAHDARNTCHLSSRIEELRKLCVIRPLWKNANVDEIDRRVKRALRLREELQMSRSAREPSRDNLKPYSTNSEPESREGRATSESPLRKDTPKVESAYVNNPSSSKFCLGNVHPISSRSRVKTHQSVLNPCHPKDHSKVSQQMESKEPTLSTHGTVRQITNEERQSELGKPADIVRLHQRDEIASCSKACASEPPTTPVNSIKPARRDSNLRLERSLSFHEESVSEATSRPKRPSSVRTPCGPSKSQSQNISLKRSRVRDKNSPPTKISKVENITPEMPQLVEPLVQSLPQVPLASFVEWFIETSDPKNFISSDRSSTSSDKPLDETPNQNIEKSENEQRLHIPGQATHHVLPTNTPDSSTNFPEWIPSSPHNPWCFHGKPNSSFAPNPAEEARTKSLTTNAHPPTHYTSTFLDTPSSVTYAMSTLTTEGTAATVTDGDVMQQPPNPAPIENKVLSPTNENKVDNESDPRRKRESTHSTDPSVKKSSDHERPLERRQNLTIGLHKQDFERQTLISANLIDKLNVEFMKNKMPASNGDLENKETLNDLGVKNMENQNIELLGSKGESKQQGFSFYELTSQADKADQKEISNQHVYTEDTDNFSSRSDDLEDIRMDAINMVRGLTQNCETMDEDENPANRCGPTIRHILMKLRHANDSEDQTMTRGDRTRITVRKSSDVTGIIAKFQNDLPQ